MPPKADKAPAFQKQKLRPYTQPPPKKRPETPFAVKPIGAFYLFFIANLIAALYAPIQDCDETFNYWEPTHFISHAYGLQTWEYSPEYAIRSWLYVALHALVGSFRRLLPFSTKLGEFYFIRYVLAFVCAICQTLMFRVVNNTLNPRVALFFFFAMIFSPGMFHASASYLPSSFAMYCTMLGMSAFMNWKGGLKTSWGIFYFAVGGILGWPFAMALSLPFLIEEVILASLSSKEAFIDTIIRTGRGVIAGLLVLLFEFIITGFFYKKVVVVPLNIVLYNIFSGPGRGPEIYGTEPWHFYIRNLLLNFNIWFILAVLAMPLFALQKVFTRSQQTSTINGLRSIVFMSPFYLWLAIFSFQPHKEERFMYPMYPCLALNAAMALHIILAAFGNSSPKSFIGMLPARLKLLIISMFLIGSVDIGAARIYGIYKAYAAPLKIYQPLEKVGGHGDSVCFGKEWYRFPSSYHLPRGMRAKFVKSDFSGLLPGEFSEAKLGFWAGAWLMPSGMNDQNLEDMGKYVDLRTCDFLVDTYYPGSSPSQNEPHYILDVDHWEPVACQDFLDASRTHILSRTIWLPDWPIIPEKYRRKWGDHCLLKRKGKK
ncbi:glycosyltransferase family 22 protein [Mollisia scopiformis]|uniref:Mannosyltransferase n=1 Tax=Mollisia scopiformis TaxID=149040 RepID=A0A194XB25_MOLSC|nr:glycosyltransferase family 22 protein [Mollisia scopiformis]KUJ16952.1 glycosyltransferase family 22 protein [Mollisia scopiformis]